MEKEIRFLSTKLRPVPATLPCFPFGHARKWHAHRYDDFPRYEVSTLLERERSIQEISGQIQDYALPFFARFSDLPKLLDDVEREGFFPHRKGFDVPKRNREFIECFREYLQKQ